MALLETLSVLVVGSGAREHAIAWKLSKSTAVSHVFVVPANACITQGLCGNKVTGLDHEVDPHDFEAIVQEAKKLGIGLVVPGSDAQVVGGLRNVCSANGLRCFAPFKDTARLEGSKAFAKDFMRRHQIPTARYATFKEFEPAARYIRDADHQLVIKSSGLAAGKGVVVTRSKDEALRALQDMMLEQKFGAEAASEVVIEERLDGFEISILTFSDGKSFKSMLTAQDHKRAYEGDEGPNTGGMGCIAPVPEASEEMLDVIDNFILKPTFDGIIEDGLSAFCGMLFTGIMMTSDGPRVLEYNVRPGDPEMQTLLTLLHDDCDLFEIMFACTESRLAETPMFMKKGTCVTVVIASDGYPDQYETGRQIVWKDLQSDSVQDIKCVPHFNESSMIFHAATKDLETRTVCNGGRVLCVAGFGEDIDAAAAAAYRTVSHIRFDGCFFRSDIGHRYRVMSS